MKKLALHWKIIAGMILGVLFGLMMTNYSWGKDLVTDWIEPFGIIFIRALKMIAVPLILASLIKGISDLKDISSLSKMGTRTIGLYLITTIVAVTIGLVAVNITKPGNVIKEDTRAVLMEEYQDEAKSKLQLAEEQLDRGPLAPLVEMVPDNFFRAASDNKKMLQVIFFAIFMGIGLILIEPTKAAPVKAVIDGFNEVILKIIDIFMLYAPVGVFALLAGLIVSSPNADLLLALVGYGFTVVGGLAIMIALYILTIKIFTGKSPKFFINGISPAQLLAFSTSSSAATLPVTMERVEEHLGVDEEVSSFVLPIGATINMDGTSLYQAVAAVFIAQAFNMDLDLTTQLGIILMATLSSIGSAAVPSAGIIMLIAVLSNAGIPEAGVALIFAIDRPLDMCRTTVNVTGDATVSMLVAKSVNKLGQPEVKDWDDHYEPKKEA